MHNARWPVLSRYPQARTGAIAMPLGGIGTGTISLGGRGDLRDWEVMNKPHKQTPSNCFAAAWAKPRRGAAVTRCLEGALAPPFTGATGATAANHGLPRFRHCRFLAAYPFGQVELSDPAVPLGVRLEAFNPLIPGDAEASGLPIAALRYVLKNDSRDTVDAAICWSLENFIGWEHQVAKPSRNRNAWRAGEGACGIEMTSAGVPALAPQWGTLALATTARAEDTTHRLEWSDPGWAGSLLDFWEDFSSDGRLEPRASGIDAPVASLAARVSIPPRSQRSLTFIIAWHFPNRVSWSLPRTPGATEWPRRAPLRIGNHYSTVLADALQVGVYVARTLCRALRICRGAHAGIVSAFCAADLPHPGQGGGAVQPLPEPCGPRPPSAPPMAACWAGRAAWIWPAAATGSCTHVWNYEDSTTPFLFGERWPRSMREIEVRLFLHRPSERAYVLPRRPADRTRAWLDHRRRGRPARLPDEAPPRMAALRRRGVPAAPVAGGAQGHGVLLDPRGLGRRPRWRDGGLPAQHHGRGILRAESGNPILVPGRAARAQRATMARHLGEEGFAATCKDLFTRGSRWTDRHLFNGEYYEQQVRPIPDAKEIAEGLRTDMGAKQLADPDFQLGPGCLSDQLLGQLHAHVTGLGPLCDPAKARKALASVMRHNYRADLSGHFNPLRSYALGDEGGLLVATFPRGGRPRRPFPYCDEVWTGLEYTAALGMIYQGLERDGLRIIAGVRARHDGAKRNPFNEPECGHHYARAMSAWGAVLALTGFHWSAPEGAIAFRAAPGTHWFWSNGSAWGTVDQRPAGRGIAVRLTVLFGELNLSRLALAGAGSLALPEARRLRAGGSFECAVPRSPSARRAAAATRR